MKISTIMDHIDSGHIALPEFQRGYVWNGDQVRSLMQSLYRGHPVGSLLVWVTESEGAQYRGDGQVAPGVVRLLLDGQQRMTSLYGIIRGEPPRFFDGSPKPFTGLHFHLEREEFVFYSPIKMRDDKLWIDVTKLMKEGMGPFLSSLAQNQEVASNLEQYMARLNAVSNIKETDLHVEEVTGKDKTIDIVVDIFNRVNSGGTKLSQGDLALAKVCAEFPDAREKMKITLKKWHDAGFQFDLDWLLRNVNTVATGEAKFNAMHDVNAETFQDGFTRAEKAIDYLLNIISGRLGLDHDRVLFGKYAIPVMVHYLDRKGGHFDDEQERDKLLYWYLQSAMWGRFSGSTESFIDRDLQLIEQLDGGLDRLIEELKVWRGDLLVKSEHFSSWSVGARFYPILYLLTRIGEARDWGTGIPLKRNLLGRMNQLEVHHIFPKSLLYKQRHSKPDVNALGNFCFLTKDTNLQIRDTLPEVYFPQVEDSHPGALASQWIPMDPELWKLDNYLLFLKERRRLLAKAANEFLIELLHAPVPDEELLEEDMAAPVPITESVIGVPGGVEDEEEEELLLEFCAWVEENGLPSGQLLFELTDPNSGEPLAIFDVAWPSGLQEEYSQPVALLINESPDTLALANGHGFRCFTDIEDFKEYIERTVLAQEFEISP